MTPLRRRSICLLLLVAASGCLEPRQHFTCRSSGQCTLDAAAGRCEPSGYCSFPALDCASGWRYGHWAARPLADQCVAEPCGAGGGGMVAVPAGTFSMGCAPGDPACMTDESPLHSIRLSAFEIDRTEVTQAAFKTCVDAAACSPPSCGWDPATRPEHPVTCVTWEQARFFCTWIGKRLPTEAEWERTARGDGDARVFPWGDDPPTCELANYQPACVGGTGDAEPVCTHPFGQSPTLALNMSGNVSEWVADLYGFDYYATSPMLDPAGPAAGTDRILRGGRFNSGQAAVRVSNRSRTPPGMATADAGFRCAR